jgi:drug/metabolite transporter (DMT)-like permease
MAGTPTAAEGQTTDARSMIFAVILCAIYIAISAVLINFNKYMMHKDRFPFAMMLTTCHMTVSWISGILLYLTVPSLFPSMNLAKNNKLKILKYFCPLGLLFAIGVVLSNQAYLYCSVAFLQFMKQANVAIMFGLSCLVGSQVCDRLKVSIILWIMAGAATAVTGEVKFVLVGFLIQVGSQLGECMKNILQEYILSGSEIKLDPLTYQIFMCPVCLVVLCFGNFATWDSAIIGQAKLWWPYLLPNAFCAFALNVTIAVLIKQTSAMAFILAGVVKDMVIVCASTFLFGDSLAHQQIFGFSVATSGIFVWSYCKVRPNDPLVLSFSHALGMRSALISEFLSKKASPADALEDSEKDPLVVKDKSQKIV